MGSDAYIVRIKILYTILALAFVFVLIGCGGLLWQWLIIPELLLITYIFINGKYAVGNVNIIIMILLILSAISIIFTKGDIQTAIYETEKLCCFFTAVLAGYNSRNTISFKHIIFLAALFTAIMGIIAFCGIIHIEEFVFYDRSILRLQSFIKYANVTACLLGCGYFSFLHLYNKKTQKLPKLCGAVILIALYLTFSKGCIPLFILCGTFLIYKNSDLLKTFIVQNTACILFTLPIMFAAAKHMYFVSFILVVTAVILCGITLEIDGAKLVKIFIGWCCALFAGAIIILILKPNLLETLGKRLVYMQDAIKLLKINPLIGCGTGSWRILQYGVQSNQYSVTYLHNGILQLLVENGIIFVIFFSILLITALIRLIKCKDYCSVSMMILIVLHSLIDIDLSFAVILIILGIIIGNAYSYSANICTIKHTPKIAVFLLICFCTVNVYMISEFIIRSAFENSYLKDNYSKSNIYAKRLELICPYDSKLKVTIAALKEKSDNNPKNILPLLEQAVLLSPYDKDVYKEYINYAIYNKDIEKLCRHYIELAPKQEDTYVFLTSCISDAANRNIVSDEKKEKCMKIINEYQKQENVINRNEMLNKITQQ